MATTAENYHGESKPAGLLRFAIWISRFPLVIATVIFTGISLKYLFDPVRTAAESGMAFNSGLAITTGRIGFGAFPLAFAVITLSCLISRRRVLAGLYVVLTVIGAVFAVRVVGMLIDNSVKGNVRLLMPEIVLLLLSSLGLSIELRRRRHEMESQRSA